MDLETGTKSPIIKKFNCMAANSKNIHSTLITIKKGDLTKEVVDVIVNAANKTLLGGGGVDAAIHESAGPLLLEECKTLGGCKTGEAKITKGYNLPARYVIHTVGPIYGQEHDKEDKLLADCYLNSIDLAYKYNLKSIAFPAISTGAYGFPPIKAAVVVADLMLYLAKKQPRLFHHFDKFIFTFHTVVQRDLFEKHFSSVFETHK